MSVRVRFHTEARADLREAMQHYETQSEGLGAELLDEVYARITDAIRMPAIAGAVVGAPPYVPARRVLLSRFPYVLVVMRDDRTFLVLSVSDSRRKPFHWLSRARGAP